MAPRYPTYQRSAELSASIVTPPNIDQAALREQAKGYASMAEGADRVMNFAFKEGEKRAKSRGTASGAADPTGTLEQFGGQRPVSNFEQQAAFDAAVGLASVEIETEARVAMQQTMLRYQKDKGNPQDLQQELNDIREGYASAVDDLDPLSAAKLNAKLSAAGQSLFLNYSADDLRVQEKERQAQGVTLYADAKRMADTLGRQTGSDDDLATMLAYYTDSAEQLGQTGTPAFARGIETIKNDFHIARVRGAFEKSNDKETFIKEFRDDLDKGTGLARGLFEGDKKTLGNEQLTWMRRDAAAIKAAIAAKNASIRAQSTAVSKDANAIAAAVTGGLPVSKQRGEELLVAAGQTGDDETIRIAEEAVAKIKFFDDHKRLPPAQLLQLKRLLTAKAVEDKNTTPFEKDMIDLVSGMATRAEKMRDKPVEFYRETNPETPLTPVNLADSTSLRARNDEMNNFSTIMFGTPPSSYLSADEVTDLSLRVASANVSQRMLILGNIAESFDDKGQAVFSQLKNLSPVAAHAGQLLVTNGDQDLVAQALIGSDALNPENGEAVKIESAESDLINVAVRTQASSLDANSKAMLVTFVKNVVAGRRSLNAAYQLDNLPEIINRSEGAIYSPDGNHIGGGFVEYNGQTVLVPPNVDVEPDSLTSLETLIKGTKTKSLKQVSYVGGFGTGGAGYETITSYEIDAADLDSLDALPYLKGKPLEIDDNFRDNITLHTRDGVDVTLFYGSSPLLRKDGSIATMNLNDLIDLQRTKRDGLDLF